MAFGIKVVCALLSCAVLGCADASCDLGEAVRRCVGRMSLESASDFQNAERLCEEAARLLLQRPSPEARKAMERLGGYYREIAFDDRTYFTRVRFIREGFETGPFTRYFHSLSAPSRHEWMERLSVVARRKVVIWDPDNQMAELPVLKPGDGGRGTDAAPGMRTERLGDGVEAIMRPVKKPK